mgnify:CR=1 FL=1
MKDAMFVFDASGSMGTTDLTAKKPHIARVIDALRIVVPEIPADRKMGLIVYGEGEYNKCDSIELRLAPQPNAGPLILSEVEKVRPAGRTPLADSVEQAADVLNYRNNPSVVILLTDGEETCGGKPCDLAKHLRSTAQDLTVHVIGYRNVAAGGLTATSGARCLAEDNGGLYLSVESTDQLIEALRKTLTCPMITQLPPAHPDAPDKEGTQISQASRRIGPSRSLERGAAGVLGRKFQDCPR